jgi:hypothetical protein
MNRRAEIHLLELERPIVEDVTPDTPFGPPVFVRTISTPSAPPWDQARAAELEARLGAPLPLDQVTFQIRRLGSWAFGQPGRFAVCYIRAREIGDQFETTVEADGQPLRIRFVSRAERVRRARATGSIAALMAIGGLLVAGAVGAALSIRFETKNKLAGLEQTVAVRMREAQREAHLKAQTRLLNTAGVRGDGLENFLSDLVWASASKTAGAHIDALHWQHGYMGVEVRGDATPFAKSDRTVLKSPKPLRSGVWLWGVEPARRASPDGPADGRDSKQDGGRP